MDNLLFPINGNQYDYYITSVFGIRDNPTKPGVKSYHGGIDIGGATGASILSMASGEVVFVGTAAGYGNTVVIKNSDGTSFLYAHMEDGSTDHLFKGDAISQGMNVGIVGNSGIGTGPHLHLEHLTVAATNAINNNQSQTNLGIWHDHSPNYNIFYQEGDDIPEGFKVGDAIPQRFDPLGVLESAHGGILIGLKVDNQYLNSENYDINDLYNQIPLPVEKPNFINVVKEDNGNVDSYLVSNNQLSAIKSGEYVFLQSENQQSHLFTFDKDSQQIIQADTSGYAVYDPEADNSSKELAKQAIANIIQDLNAAPISYLTTIVNSSEDIGEQQSETYGYATSAQLDKIANSFGLAGEADFFSGSNNEAWDDFTFSHYGGDNAYMFELSKQNYTLLPEIDENYIPNYNYGSGAQNPNSFMLPSASIYDSWDMNDNWGMNPHLSNSSYSYHTVQNWNSPLTLDLDGDSDGDGDVIDLTHAYDQKVYFDIDGDGFAERVGWVKPGDGQLAYDVNGNGNIDDITELFGDDIMPAFEKLALHDSNANGKIDQGDDTYDELLVWRDLDMDGQTDDGELKTLFETGVKEISLAEILPQGDRTIQENFISSYSHYTKFDNTTHQIADVHFLNDNIDTWFNGAKSQVFGSEYQVNMEALLLPLSRGYGSLPSLHIAMTDDMGLLGMMRELVELNIGDLSELSTRMEAFLYRWAGVQDNDPDARTTLNGTNVDGRKVDFLEQFTGVEWSQLGADVVGSKASIGVKKVWTEVESMLGARILVQGTFSDIFANAIYDFKTDTMSLGNSMAELISAAQSHLTNVNFTDDAKDFWLAVGNILVIHRDELGETVQTISNAVDVAYGAELFMSQITLTQEDGDIHSQKDGLIETITTNVFEGTAANDTISGSQANDYIVGLGGADELSGRGGDDWLRGDDNADVLNGGAGDDRLEGQDGADQLNGGNGRDDLRGGAGADTLTGGDGSDKLHGGAGADVIDGGAGNDEIDYLESDEAVYVNLNNNISYGGHAQGDSFTNVENITGSDFSDVLVGDVLDNVINGERGDDELIGNAGNDTLFGADGDDSLSGGAGNDMLLGYEGAEVLDGGAGSDEVNYSHPYLTEGVMVNLSEGRGYQGAAQGDSYISIENIVGTTHDDVLIGDSNNNIIVGNGGNDHLLGNEGNDTLKAGDGTVWMTGGAGNDVYQITPSQKISSITITDFDVNADMLDLSLLGDEPAGGNQLGLAAVNGNVLISVGTHYKILLKDVAEANMPAIHITAPSSWPAAQIVTLSNLGSTLSGDAFDNVLVGTRINDTIDGDAGSDTIYGFSGDDSLLGGSDNDVISGSLGSDTIDGGAGNDFVSYVDSYEGVVVNLNTQTVSGGTANGDVISSIENAEGSQFADVITGSNAQNILYGNGGADTLIGYGNNNTLYGGSGDDVFVVGVEANSITKIADFEVGDTIDLTAFSTLTELFIVPGVGGEFYSSLHLPNGQRVRIENTAVQELDDSMFKFAAGVTPTITRQIVGNSAGNFLVGTQEDDQIFGQGGSDIIYDYIGNDSIVASDDNVRFDVIHSPGYSVNTIRLTQHDNDQDIVKNVQNYRYDFIHYEKSYINQTPTVGYFESGTYVYNNTIFDLTNFAHISNFSDLSFTEGEIISGSGVTSTFIDLGFNQELILDAYKQFTKFEWEGDSDVIETVGGNDRYGGKYITYELTAANFIFYNGTLTGNNLSETLKGAGQADAIFGYDGNDLISGGANNDTIDGGKGHDTIEGGLGSDVLTGGDQTDHFVITLDAASTDTITDFEFWRSGEVIDLTAFNSQFANFAALKQAMSTVNNDTHIDLGNNQTLIIQGVQADQLSRANFMGNAAINSAPTITGLGFATSVIDALVPWSELLDTSTINDVDGDWLEITANLSNGNPLPEWMSFNPKSYEFSGTPEVGDVGTYSIIIRADDGDASVEQTINLEVMTADQVIHGTAASEMLVGDIGNDTIDGLGGDDTLVGGVGNDSLIGGDGNDSLQSGVGSDTLDGGNDFDIASYANSDAAVDINLATGINSGGDAQGDQLLNIEQINLTAYADIITGSAGEDILYGQAGDDTLQGGNGNDYLDGGLDKDSLSGGLGNDTIYGGGETDNIDGGDGDDSLYGQEGWDTIHGGDGNDFLDAGEGKDLLYGGAGNDTLSLYDGNDTGYGGTGNDSIYALSSIDQVMYGEGGSDTLDGGLGNDTLYGGSGADEVYGNAGADSIRGDTSNDTLYGGDGDDSIDGGAHDDLIYGDAGNDWLRGHSGDDTVHGGSGNDTFEGWNGNDVFYGDAGDDLLDGHEDDDSIFGGLGHDTLYGSSGHDVLQGDDGNDSLRGDSGNDTIIAGTGDDEINAGSDDDSVDGGAGNDSILAGTGHDTVHAGDGNDTLYGWSGDDFFYGGTGDDRLDGHEDNDSLFGEDDNDTINGGDGFDYIEAGNGADIVWGNNHNDTIYGNDGDDYLNAGGGNDTLYGGDGNDTIRLYDGDDIGYGGTGNDSIEGANTYAHHAFYGDGGSDTLSGGHGNDTLYGGSGGDEVYGNAGADSIRGDTSNDTLHGGDGDDSIDGGAHDDLIYGDAGNDWLRGHSGDDTVYGGSGNDTFEGWNGNDVFYGGEGNDVLDGHEDNDSLYGGVGDDTLYGNSGHDVLQGDEGNDSLRGDSGNDTIIAGAGDDEINAGSDDDSVDGGIGNDSILSGTGHDTVHAGDGHDTLYGWSGHDVFYGGAGNDRLDGHEDNDTIDGGIGDDVIHGGSGLDSITAGDGNDTVWGNEDNDLIYGNGGNDYLNAGSGNDTIYGGDGNDTIRLYDGDDIGYGGLGDDSLVGANTFSNHTLNGDDGDDTLDGGHGNDYLNGGNGADTLFGGVGDDVFMYAALTDSHALAYDNITDFTKNEDLIDVTALALHGITSMGDLTVANDGTNTIISANSHDFEIELNGILLLDEHDFMFG